MISWYLTCEINAPPSCGPPLDERSIGFLGVRNRRLHLYLYWRAMTPIPCVVRATLNLNCYEPGSEFLFDICLHPFVCST